MCKKHEVHFCVGPLGDCARVWVGNDPTKYVDCIIFGGAIGEADAIVEWYKKYGEIILEEWENYYPLTVRKQYLRLIQEQEYSEEEAEKILQYLPQTDDRLMSSCVNKMISLWEENAPISPCVETSSYKEKIAEGEEDYWQDEPYSPRAAAARREGLIEAKIEIARRIAEMDGISLEQAVESLGLDGEDRDEVLKSSEQM